MDKCDNCKYLSTKLCNTECLHYRTGSRKEGVLNPKHEKIRKMIEDKIPAKKIAEKLGITINNVRTVACRLGLRTKVRFREKEIAEYYKAHGTKETCRKFKCRADQVWAYASRRKDD